MSPWGGGHIPCRGARDAARSPWRRSPQQRGPAVLLGPQRMQGDRDRGSRLGKGAPGTHTTPFCLSASLNGGERDLLPAEPGARGRRAHPVGTGGSRARGCHGNTSGGFHGAADTAQAGNSLAAAPGCPELLQEGIPALPPPHSRARSAHTRGGEGPRVPGQIPTTLLPLFHPSAGGKLEDRTTQLLQSMAAPIIPSWLTQKWFPSRLSPCRDSSVVSPPHVQHTGRPGRGSAARKSLAQGSYLLVHGLLGWLCSCMAAPLARLGTHLSLWSWHGRTMSPAAPNLRKNLIISPDTCLPGEPEAQADWGQEKAPKCQHILSL